MNEKIKELAKQANINFSRVGILDGDPNGVAKFVGYSKMEKFAELIIKECLDFLEVGRVNGLYIGEVSRGIKEHFEVEEQEKSLHKCSVCGTTENVAWVGGYLPYLCDSLDCIPF